MWEHGWTWWDFSGCPAKAWGGPTALTEDMASGIEQRGTTEDEPFRSSLEIGVSEGACGGD